MLLGCAGQAPYDGPSPMTSATAASPDDTGGPGPSTTDDAGTDPAASGGSSDEGSTSVDPTTSPSGTTGEPDPTSTSTGAEPPNGCAALVDDSLTPPTTCDGPSGNTTTQIPSNGVYSTSWFGCYFNADGTIHEDPADNCEFACGNQGLCSPGQDGPTCEANLRWFAADADRYGCGGRIRVTNCDNDKSVVLVTLDRGPNCGSVEQSCDTPVLDMSHDAMVYLFDGSTYGGCDHQRVLVEGVPDDTPLGPIG